MPPSVRDAPRPAQSHRNAAVSTSPDDDGVRLPNSRQWSQRSRHTGRDYRILVSMPDRPAPTAGWPVLYLLDGNLLFPTAHSLARLAAHAGGHLDLDLAAPVVVAIGHHDDGALFDPARHEDYTPPAPDLSDTGDCSGNAQGGGDRFLDFLEHELMPRVHEHLPVDRQRQTLAGHSYGGLLTLHALFTRRGLFHGHVAGSPSLWWNHGWILGERDAFVAAASRQPAGPPSRLLVTIGTYEQTPAAHRDGRARDALIRQRRMVDGAHELVQSLATLPDAAGLDVVFRELPGVNHIGAALPMLIEAFAFLRDNRDDNPSGTVS